MSKQEMNDLEALPPTYTSDMCRPRIVDCSRQVELPCGVDEGPRQWSGLEAVVVGSVKAAPDIGYQ
jgi:hypothetical protein